MTDEDINPPPPPATSTRSQDLTPGLPEHHVRRALLDLLDEVGTVTATQAAARLGYSSGLCSFHLRRLARYGQVVEAPRTDARARHWRLRQAASPSPDTSPVEEFAQLARGLEDESYQQWLAQRDQAPDEWRQDEAFSAVVYLTPEEVAVVGEAMRETLARYRNREQQRSARPDSARPVAVITRLFPLLAGPSSHEG